MKFPKFERRSLVIWGIALAIFCIAASPSFQSFNSGQFGTAGNVVAIKPGSGQTGNVFYGTITLPTGQKVSDIIISNSFATTDHGSNGWQINTVGWNTTINDAQLALTLATWSPTNLYWTWNVTNIFTQPIIGTGPGSGVFYLVGTNGNSIAINAAQQSLTFTGNTNVNVNMSAGHSFTLIATTNIFLSVTGLCCGQTANILVVQDSTGGRSLSWNTNFVRFGTNYDNTLDTNAGRYSVITVVAGPYCTNGLAGVRKGF